MREPGPDPDLVPLVLHVDMDAFFASVEIRSDPRLASLPVVVGGGPGDRGVVTAASYAIRPFGVRSGMSMAEARRLCPGLMSIPVDPPKMIHESLEVLAILDRFSARVEPASIDEAYLEFPAIPGARWPEIATELGTRVRQAIRQGRGLTCTVGAASNKLQAKMGSALHKPDALNVLLPGRFLEVFGEHPVRAIPGIGEKSAAALAVLGIRTVAELALASPAALRSRFGTWAEGLRDQARGTAAATVVALGEEAPPRSAGHETTFPRDVADPRELRATVWLLADRVARRLRRAGLQGHTVAARFKIGTRRFSRQRRLSTPVDQALPLARHAWELLEQARKGRALRLVGVAAQDLVPGSAEAWLFPEDLRRLGVTSVADRLRDRFGELALVPAGSLRSPGVRPRAPGSVPASGKVTPVIPPGNPRRRNS